MDRLISLQAAIAVADSTDYLGLAIEDVKKVTDEVVKGLKQLPSAQPETHGKRTETHARDLIRRQAAIDELCDNCDHVEAVCPHYPCKQYIAIENLPSEQPEQSDTSEFWRKRADYYSDMCFKLIADMGAGVKIEAVKIDETGITFTKKKPPTQQEINCSEIPNSSDTISRQLAIDVLDQIFGSIPMEQTTEILTFRRALRKLPPAQPETDWTPVSKKKHPDKEGEYLVTDDAGGMATVDEDGFMFLDDGTPCWRYSQNVTAWRELPEPYAERLEA